MIVYLKDRISVKRDTYNSCEEAWNRRWTTEVDVFFDYIKTQSAWLARTVVLESVAKRDTNTPNVMHRWKMTLNVFILLWKSFHCPLTLLTPCGISQNDCGQMLVQCESVPLMMLKKRAEFLLIVQLCLNWFESLFEVSRWDLCCSDQHFQSLTRKIFFHKHIFNWWNMYRAARIHYNHFYFQLFARYQEREK